MTTEHDVFLVPGFFGFADFGEFRYFAHVRQLLPGLLAARGLDAEVHDVRVLPTASLPRRAATLLETIEERSAPGRAVHIIGHSTGGLDARLLLAPGVELPGARALESIAGRVRSVISIATPHHGTPLADVLTSAFGQLILRVLSATTIHTIRLGGAPLLPVLTRFTDLLAPVGSLVGARGGLLEQLYKDLLRNFTREDAAKLEAFFRDINVDRTLLPQLGASAMELFNTRCSRRPGVRYGSVVLQAKRPTLAGVVESGLGPFDQASYGLYRAIHTLTQASASPPLSSEQRDALRVAYGEEPDARANDAIVPTNSQVWGTVITATWADHLDVLGFFDGPRERPPHNDWLRTLSGFTRAKFVETWSRVADFIAQDLGLEH